MLVKREMVYEIKKTYNLIVELNYTTKEFEKFYDHKGINYELIVSYTPKKME